MRELCRDIRQHWPGALLLLGYWLAAWSFDAATAIHVRGEPGGDRTGPWLVLTWVIPLVLGAALAAWWRAPEANAPDPGRRSLAAGALAGLVVCEVNLAIVFCEDAGVSTFFSSGKARFDLLIAGIILGVAGAVAGFFTALGTLGLRRVLAFLRTRDRSKPLFPSSGLRKWSRGFLIAGLFGMVAGALDPLEGAAIILPASGVAAFGGYLAGSRTRQLLYSAFISIAAGVGALIWLTMIGGTGYNTGRSDWWGLVALPYPAGWVMGVIGAGLSLKEIGPHRATPEPT